MTSEITMKRLHKICNMKKSSCMVIRKRLHACVCQLMKGPCIQVLKIIQ